MTDYLVVNLDGEGAIWMVPCADMDKADFEYNDSLGGEKTHGIRVAMFERTKHVTTGNSFSMVKNNHTEFAVAAIKMLGMAFTIIDTMVAEDHELEPH